MRPRDIFWPLFCAAAGAGLVYLLRIALGSWPNFALVGGIIVMSVGVGLVGARFSRLGPFDGELGAPWFENDLRETLSWEYERAARYARTVALVIMQQRPGSPDWNAVVRAVDRVISCRNHWTILILPETTRDGAVTMLLRLGESGSIVHSAVIQLPTDVESRDALPKNILAAMRATATSEAVYANSGSPADIVPLSA